ncbi:hypothetical protein GPECTOR_362g134 [Gonium pectorale]|uniref:Uncharacterized protein n=1 Tax=Gonium pectorale TaxID=33097 RepID=A0A150FVH7_GONPE|nr:hypothetical protein GPECTOR_362g134 [Gonium pectorale]|eukprot:KXZ41614.1 hypothetical protein GPECTOR_362g134 [Gonium pectorale]
MGAEAPPGTPLRSASAGMAIASAPYSLTPTTPGTRNGASNGHSARPPSSKTAYADGRSASLPMPPHPPGTPSPPPQLSVSGSGHLQRLPSVGGQAGPALGPVPNGRPTSAYVGLTSSFRVPVDDKTRHIRPETIQEARQHSLHVQSLAFSKEPEVLADSVMLLKREKNALLADKVLDDSRALDTKLSSSGGAAAGLTIAEAEARMAELNERLGRLTAERDHLVSRLESELTYRRTQAAAVTAGLQRQLSEAQAQVSEAQTQVSDAQQAASEAQQQLLANRESLAAANEALAEAREELRGAREALAELLADLDAAAKEAAEAERLAEVAEAKRAAAEAEAKAAEAEGKAAEAAGKAAEAEARAAEAAARAAEAEARAGEREARLAELVASTEEAEATAAAMLRAKEALLSETKQQLHELQSSLEAAREAERQAASRASQWETKAEELEGALRAKTARATELQQQVMGLERDLRDLKALLNKKKGMCG